jgi:hypothetical protein
MGITLRRSFGLGLAALALTGIIVVLASGAAAQDPGTSTLTFKALDKGSTFAHVRNTKPKSQQANPTGDVIVFTNPVADASRKVVGKLFVHCTTTKGARHFMRSTTTCAGVIELRDGTLTLQANSRPGVPTTTGAVTGGTGAYANSRGVFVSEESSEDLTITLAS